MRLLQKSFYKEKKYPLEIIFLSKLLSCSTNWIVVDPKELFEDYVYVSGTSPVFVNHFHELCKRIVDQFKPSLNNYVLDIGSNDGTLLKFFKEMGYSVIGIDPAKKYLKRLVKKVLIQLTVF